MPSRWMSLTIVACWLAAMGWLFWHDLWPNWRPGEPPPFHIDLVEEVQRSDKLRNSWTVRRQKAGESAPQEIFRAFTSVEYIKDEDAFLLKAEYNARRDAVPGRRTHSFEAAGFRVVSMSSQYRVDRAGELRGLRAKIEVMPLERMEKVLTAFGQKPDNPPYLLLWGEVRGNELFTHCKSNFVPSQTIDLPPASVSHNGSVIMPLHPVNRIHGLRPARVGGSR